MRWDEVVGDVWTVPGERMKAGREHRVPLAPRALEILEESREHTGGEGLVFPSITGRVMTDSTMSKLVKELGIEGTPHGNALGVPRLGERAHEHRARGHGGGACPHHPEQGRGRICA